MSGHTLLSGPRDEARDFGANRQGRMPCSLWQDLWAIFLSTFSVFNLIWFTWMPVGKRNGECGERFKAPCSRFKVFIYNVLSIYREAVMANKSLGFQKEKDTSNNNVRIQHKVVQIKIRNKI